MEILSPNIRHFVSILRFVANYAFYKAFYIELLMRKNCVFCCNVGNTRKNNIFRKYAHGERIEGIFCVCRKPANFCHPETKQISFQIVSVFLS